MGTPKIPTNNGTTIHIPVEIIDEILDYLRSNKSCLRSCALVSKSWTYSCRRHLFGRVDFGSPFDFVAWSRCIPATPDGPHLHTRELRITNRYIERGCYLLPQYPAAFFQHCRLFHNVQNLAIEYSGDQQAIDNFSVPEMFSHLLGTLRSLSIRGASCSPQAMISLVASFQHLERLELHGIWFEDEEIPQPLPEQRIFKGTFHLMDWNDSSEEFVNALAQHDLRYREVSVNGECWLRDTTRNQCLAKCVDHLEKFRIHWSGSKAFRSAQFKPLSFGNLRNLAIQSSLEHTTVLPPPEFLSSIMSTNLSEITIDLTLLPPGKEVDEALDAIRSYDAALCQLANQLDPYPPGNEKLTLMLGVVEESPDLPAVLPQFSKLGVLKVEANRV